MSRTNPSRNYGDRWKAFCHTVTEQKDQSRRENEQAALARSQEPAPTPEDRGSQEWDRIMAPMRRSVPPLKVDPETGEYSVV